MEDKMIGFYLVKILAIVTISLVYFIVLAAFGFALTKVFPDNPSETIQ
jgi:hypothetical protein